MHVAPLRRSETIKARFRECNTVVGACLMMMGGMDSWVGLDDSSCYCGVVHCCRRAIGKKKSDSSHRIGKSMVDSTGGETMTWLS